MPTIRMGARFEDRDHVGAELARLAQAIHGAVSQGIDREALLLSRAIRTGIRTQAPAGQRFTPLAASTIALKGSSKALIDKGDLIASITTTKVRLANRLIARFVGVHRTAIGKAGQRLANIAEIHEFGTKPYTIPVTPKLRGWFNAMAEQGIFPRRMSAATRIIRHPGIPARPFLRPPFEQWSEGAEDRLNAQVLAALRRTVNTRMIRRSF
jgi:hypothetical protein